jgi:hypothetical protein
VPERYALVPGTKIEQQVGSLRFGILKNCRTGSIGMSFTEAKIVICQIRSSDSAWDEAVSASGAERPPRTRTGQL